MSIQVRNLSLKLGKFQLQNVNLELPSHEYLVILGPSGCGKTTLLECIAGIKTINSGEILVHGAEISSLPIEKRNIGFVYQNLMLFPHMNVETNVAYGLRFRKLSNPRERVVKILNDLHISHLAKRFILNLSGGEKQRVALARALVIEPQILLLDEPLSALDPKNKANSLELLREIYATLAPVIIHVTHDHQEALSVASKIGVMDQGNLVQIDTAQNIFQKPASKFIAEFTCADNLFEGYGEIIDGQTRVKIGQKENAIRITSEFKKEGKLNLLVHPSKINIGANGNPKNRGNLFQGRVISVKDLNQMIQMTVDVGIPLTVHLTRQGFREMNLQMGSSIQLSFDAKSAHIF